MGTLELSYCFITHTSTLAHFMQSSSLLPSLSRHRPLSRIHDSHVLDPSLSFRSPFLPLVNLAAPAFPPFESSSTFIASGDPTVICLTSAPVESSLSGALGDDLIYYTAPAIIRISLPPIPYSDVHSPSRPLLPIILPRLPLIVYPSSQELLLGWNQGQAITGDHSTPAVPPPPSSSYYNRHIPHGPPPYTTSTNPTLPPNLMHSNTMSQYWMPPMSPPPQPSMDPTALRNDPHDLHPPPYDPSPSLYYPPYTKMELQDPRMAIVRVSPVPLLRLVDIATQRPAASFPTLRYHPTPEPPTFNDSPKYQMSVGSTSRPAHSVPPGPTVTRSSSHGFSPPVSPSAWHTRRPRRVARSSIRRSASCSIDFTDENALDQHRQSHLNQSSTVTDGTPRKRAPYVLIICYLDILYRCIGWPCVEIRALPAVFTGTRQLISEETPRRTG
jgi:hypothetical protein